jgi:type IV pilus assembly protein PilY1
MTSRNFTLAAYLALSSFAAGVGTVQADTQIDISQQPLITVSSQPPLNMLVMGKDHKIYYEAYNDASDLDGDGALDVGYKPATIDYYGYFNSHVCYTYESGNGGRFVPSSKTSDKTCSGKWSGDFLNYLATSRMDALRRVLYGGWRQVDTATDTTLQGAFFPQDAHSWGKEYQSTARDGYDISQYSPLGQPNDGTYHLFAVTTVTGNDASYPNYTAPLFRVMQNSPFRVWNWLSIEGPVAGNKCFTEGNTRVDCVPTSGGSEPYPGTPGSEAAFDTLEATYAITANLYGSGNLRAEFNGIDCDDSPSCNPYSGNQDQYLTVIDGTLTIPSGDRGTYTFAIDGDDAVDFEISGNSVFGRAEFLGDHAPCNCQSHTTAALSLGTSSGTRTYTIKFRHVENGGGALYKLYWKRPGQSTWEVVPFTNSTGTSRGLARNTQLSVYDLTPELPAGATRTDYNVRVQVCPDDTDLQDATCKKYGDHYKPTGILHDYGENQKMYFGLITGSQFDNLEGGVLRKNISNFADEINQETGQFLSGTGIANTLSGLRMIGGGYNNSVTNNLTGDTNWNWANGTGNCPSIGTRAINNGECRMWGNPIAEMMFEGMRYFAGSGSATSRFATGGADQGRTEETKMGLSQATWQDPYASDGGGYAVCSRPFETVISDINPSYDGDLPGSAFATIAADPNPKVAGFDAASQGDTIWGHEFGGTKTVFIGDVDGVTDGAPTAKQASSFGNIRGLAPEEPTKGGTYYSASVARYGAVNDLNEAEGMQRMGVYSIALASPLPRIEVPLSGGTITLLPFAKTVSGTFGESTTRKPTNTIVDFYVQEIANFPGQPLDVTVNEGRPKAIFRINYEDVEQGNDHDMDTIARYEVTAKADGTVDVQVVSEYAAGSAHQYMGYTLSGSDGKDGVYLEICDLKNDIGNPENSTDKSLCQASDTVYRFNTPPGRDPGYCDVNPAPADCAGLPPTSSVRNFAPGEGSSAIQLENPLWYAAKYGGFKDSNSDGLPDAGEWDSKVAGEPDNYFLVTNALGLRAQLDEAFQAILDSTRPSASVATSTGRFTPGSTLGFRVNYKAESWAGDVDAYPLLDDGTLEGIVYNADDGTFTVDTSKRVWSASEELAAPADRNIYIVEKSDSGYSALEFEEAELSDDSIDTLRGTLDDEIATGDLIAFLRGDSSKEQGASGCSDASPCPFRNRLFDEDPNYKFGDILNSSPVVVVKTSYGFAQLPDGVAGKDTYIGFVNGKSEHPVIYVGANDGMVHAINGEDNADYGDGGEELFAFIPNAVLGNLNELSRPSYLHRFYVDGTPITGDAYVTGAAGTLGWRTLLLGSAGVGARTVYALDVSDPEAAADQIFLWEFNSSDDADMGYLSGQPAMGLVGTPASSQWVAAFGNGMNSARGRAILFIRDLGTGASVAKIEVPETETVDLDKPNGLATPVIVDGDGDGVADTIYAGDYQGNMWKFENVGGTWSVGLGGQPLFTAVDGNGHPQSITSGAYTVANPIGGTMVIFGTGRYFNTDDADPEHAETAPGETDATPLVDTIYGVWDRSITGVTCNDDAYYALDVLSCGTVPALARGDGAILQRQEITGYNGAGHGFGVDDEGNVTYPTCPEGYRCSTRNPVDYQVDGFEDGKLGWYLDLAFNEDATSPDTLRAERVLVQPTIILGTLLASTFRPIGSTCLPGGFNALMELDPLSGAAKHAEIEPPGGWPGGVEPPLGTSGVDMGAGPPQGSPNPVVSTPTVGGIPAFGCVPDGTDECPDPDTPGIGFTECKWMLPNPANKSIQAPMPCGRISWKQAR